MGPEQLSPSFVKQYLQAMEELRTQGKVDEVGQLYGEEFARKCKESVAFTKQQYHILDQARLEERPGESNRLPEAKLLRECLDLTFFTAGPVYVHCCVPFDIFEQYRQVTGYDGPRHVFHFNHAVFDGLAAWDFIVEAMAAEKADEFRQFMTTQVIRRDKAQYWTIERHEALIGDPLAVDRNEFSGDGPTAAIDVFAPSGAQYRLVPDVIALVPKTFQRTQPDRRVIQEAAMVSTVTLPGR